MALASVGPYRVLEHLGAGANGEVSLAEDTRLHRRVALKTLSGTAAVDGSELRRRLLREARAAARLNHPHIAAVYDVLESEEGVHIVMEYVRGTTLATRIRQGPPTPMQVVDIALQLSAALVHAHSLGVIHRDLKPANIVIAPDGSTKILDFGLARLCQVDAGSVALSGSSELSGEVRHVVGTPPYIPPEHLSGDVVDERGDIYSLGVTLFELLTGRRPFEASNGMGLTQAILGAPTPRVRSLCPECPAGLDAIVYRAMSRSPRDRYASAAELSSELKRLSAGITDVPTQSRPSPLFDVRNRRPVAWTAAAVVATVMAALGLMDRGRWLESGTAPTAPPAAKVVAVLPLAGAADDPQNEALAAGVADTLITTLSKVPGLTVVSRASTLKYQDRKMAPDAIAAELGATMLVDGTLQRSGDRLRISLSLLQPGTKVARWNNTSEGTLAEMFDLQGQVVDAVVSELRLPDPAKAVKDRPTRNVEAFADYSHGRSFLERPEVKENLDRSIGLFQSAIAKDAYFAKAHAGLAEAYWRKYQATREATLAAHADLAAAQAAQLDPADPATRMARGELYRGAGRLMDAAREFKAALDLQPASDEVHRHLGTVLVGLGEPDAGIAQMQKAIALRPGYWVNHASLGMAYYNRGKFALAVESFERIIELQPNDPRGYSLLGSALHANDDTARAVNLYEKAMEFGSATASANLGMLHYELAGYDEAARHLTEAVRRDPRSALVRLNLADVYAQMRRNGEARAAYLSALELSRAVLLANPADSRALARLAVVESKLGRANDAAKHINEAVIREPKNPDVNFYHAVILVRAGRLDEALIALKRALDCGYSRKRARSDPDLALLRKHPGYLEATAD